MIFVPTILLAFSLWLAFPLPFPLPFDLSPYFPTVTPQGNARFFSLSIMTSVRS